MLGVIWSNVRYATIKVAHLYSKDIIAKRLACVKFSLSLFFAVYFKSRSSNSCCDYSRLKWFHRQCSKLCICLSCLATEKKSNSHVLRLSVCCYVLINVIPFVFDTLTTLDDWNESWKVCLSFEIFLFYTFCKYCMELIELIRKTLNYYTVNIFVAFWFCLLHKACAETQTKLKRFFVCVCMPCVCVYVCLFFAS